MKILLIISVLVPFIFWGYLMMMLDNFLVNNATSIASAGRYASAIVLGNTDLARQTIKLLEEAGLQVIHLTDPYQLVQERKLCCLFALSTSDADNIAFYKIGKKLYCIDNEISICNDRRNESMFINENIKYLSLEGTAANELFQLVCNNWR